MVRNTDRLEVACVDTGGLLMLATFENRHRLVSYGIKDRRGFGSTMHGSDRRRKGVCGLWERGGLGEWEGGTVEKRGGEGCRRLSTGSKQLPRPVPDAAPEAV